MKESFFSKDGCKKTTGRQDGEENGTPEVTPAFVIEEVGLSGRQVWAATLAELTRRGELTQSDVESWLRPAALIGRDGETLILGAPNAVSRDRIATRLLPAVRAALRATIGTAVEVEVIVGVAG